ncbi:MAG: hypothetical protein AB2A00_35630, partial [Myxococcota bacterium]
MVTRLHLRPSSTLGPACLVLMLAGGVARAASGAVAVYPLAAKAGVPQPTADLVTEALVNEVRASAVFSRVMSPRDMEAMGDQDAVRQCTSEACMLEMAGAFGADYALFGTVGQVGSSYLVNLKLMSVRELRIAGTASQRAAAASAESLLDATRPAVHSMLQQAGLMRASSKDRSQVATAPRKRLNPLLAGLGVGGVVAGLGAGVVSLACLAAAVAIRASLEVVPGSGR